MRKIIFRILLAGLFIMCASGKKTVDEPTDGEDEEEYQENLGSEEGLSAKKAKIDQLKGELQDIRTQIEEREKLLDELSNIKKVMGADTLVE